jgi:hypothetical protein
MDHKIWSICFSSEFYFFLVFIHKLKFNQVIIGIRLHLQVGFKFPLPFFDDGSKEAFREVRIHDRVNNNG